MLSHSVSVHAKHYNFFFFSRLKKMNPCMQNANLVHSVILKANATLLLLTYYVLARRV